MFEKLRQNSKIVVIIVAVAFALSGAMMGFGAFFRQQPQEQRIPEEHEELQQRSEDFNEPIAQVNDEVITRGEYNNRIQQQVEQLGQLPSSQQLNFRYQALMDLIERVLVLEEARQQGLTEDISEEAIDDYLNTLLQNFDMSEDELIQVLEMQGLSMEEFRAGLEEDLLVQEGLSRSHEDIEITEEEIREEYRQVYNGEEIDEEEFNNVRDQLEMSLREEKQREYEDQWIESLKETTEIVIYDSTLQGIRNMEQGNYEQAAENFEQSLDEATIPDSGLYIKLAQAYQQMGNTDRAVEIYEEAIEEFTQDWDLAINMGNLFMEIDEIERAEEQVNRAAEIIDEDEFLPDGQLYLAHFRLYMAYSYLGQEAQAQQHISRAQEIYQNLLARQQMQEQIPLETDEDTGVPVPDDDEIIDVEMEEEDLEMEIEDDSFDSLDSEIEPDIDDDQEYDPEMETGQDQEQE